MTNPDLSFVDQYIHDYPSIKNVSHLRSEQKKVLLNLVYSINESIIEGKYIENTNIHDTYTSKLAELSDSTQDFTNIDEAKLNDNKFYFDFFEYSVNVFTLFVEKINNLYKNDIQKFINIEIFYNPKNYYFKSFSPFLKLLDYNIEVSKIDHNFINEDSLLKDLYRFKNDVTNIRIDQSNIPNIELREKYLNLKASLLIKIEFLISKWTARKCSRLKYGKEKYINLFADTTKIKLSKIEKLNEYILKIRYIYDLYGDDNISILREEYTKIANKFKQPSIDEHSLFKLSYHEIHTLIKYYKDVTKDIQKLKKLLTFFYNEARKDTNTNIHRTFAIQISKQYCLNNYFSLYCEKFIETSNDLIDIKFSIKKFVEEYKTIKRESTYLTDNFFLDFKFLNTSLVFLNKLFNKHRDKSHEVIQKTSDFFRHTLENIIRDFDSKVQWSITNNNYIFKLPYDESLVKYKNINIYLSSSFLLPKLNEEILEAKNEISSKYQTLNLKYNTEDEIKGINELKEEYKSDNKRIIEIVTLFTAVISFIVGSIGNFKFVTDIYSAITFTCAFALALMIFILIIMRLLRKENFITGWDFICLLVLLAFVALVTLNMQKTLKPDTNTTNPDTANTIKLKIDTD